MSRTKHQQRTARRKLAEHDQGRDRHNRWLSWACKQRRRHADRSGAKRDQPKAPPSPARRTLAERAKAGAEFSAKMED